MKYRALVVSIFLLPLVTFANSPATGGDQEDHFSAILEAIVSKQNEILFSKKVKVLTSTLGESDAQGFRVNLKLNVIVKDSDVSITIFPIYSIKSSAKDILNGICSSYGAKLKSSKVSVTEWLETSNSYINYYPSFDTGFDPIKSFPEWDATLDCSATCKI